MSTSSSDAPKRVLVPIAEDSEEIETSCIQDVLVRFGAEVVVASVMPGGELVCKMSRGLKIMADTTIEEASKEDWDLIALPGGMPGASYLRDCETLITMLKKQKSESKMYGAVCASPAVVLASHGLVEAGGTCYPAPSFREVIPNSSDDDVVVQDNVVTSQGPGTSLKFALTLGEKLYGEEKADAIASEMLVQR
jgi:4-methyl-5(b-hydroxyethyl)-thiazole monophosphate biosynthesis